MRLRHLCLSGAFLLSGCLANSEPKPNLTLYKEQLSRYYYNGNYELGIKDRIDEAKSYLRHRAAQAEKTGDRIAVVLDIDETSLSNWPLLLKTEFGDSPENFDRWVRKGLARPIRPTLELFREAQSLGVPVFLITGRRTPLGEATELDLHNAGYSDWAGLYLRPITDGMPSVVPYKSGQRKAIEAEGFRIIVNVGDQLSDLEGGHSEKSYKLPNPFYFIE